jgi:hypothetical protein
MVTYVRIKWIFQYRQGIFYSKAIQDDASCQENPTAAGKKSTSICFLFLEYLMNK